jgi:hypothetical protein
VPDPATTDRMIAQHQEIFGKMRCGTARRGQDPTSPDPRAQRTSNSPPRPCRRRRTS